MTSSGGIEFLDIDTDIDIAIGIDSDIIINFFIDIGIDI